jgi:hypothetical protein
MKIASMKNLLVISLLALFSISVSAQKSDCKILSETFTEKHLAQAADRLGVSADYACIFAQKGVVIETSTKDLSGFTDIRNMRPASKDVPRITPENFDPETFNVLNYHFDIKEKEFQMYHLSGTNYMITILSKVRGDAIYEKNK